MSQAVRVYNKSEETVVYHSADNSVRLEVQVIDDTIWLSQQQMSELFMTDRTSIVRHIHNIYKTNELTESVTCAKIAQVRMEGGRQVMRTLPYYNLDMIISVGYRVNSLSATIFRQWATKVIKNYMLRGYAISSRFERLEQRVEQTERQIEYFVHSALPPKEGVFADGQIYDAYEFIQKLIRSAKKSIRLIDNYIDDSVLTMMSAKADEVKVDAGSQAPIGAPLLPLLMFAAAYAARSIRSCNKEV